MEQRTNKMETKVYSGSLARPMMIGAVVGVCVALFFIIGAGEGNPEWPKFWMVRPLIIVPLAGATGGLFFHFINRFFFQKNWSKTIAVVLSLFICLVGLWMGMILGFVGTMWH